MGVFLLSVMIGAIGIILLIIGLLIRWEKNVITRELISQPNRLAKFERKLNTLKKLKGPIEKEFISFNTLLKSFIHEKYKISPELEYPEITEILINHNQLIVAKLTDEMTKIIYGGNKIDISYLQKLILDFKEILDAEQTKEKTEKHKHTDLTSDEKKKIVKLVDIVNINYKSYIPQKNKSLFKITIILLAISVIIIAGYLIGVWEFNNQKFNQISENNEAILLLTNDSFFNADCGDGICDNQIQENCYSCQIDCGYCSEVEVINTSENSKEEEIITSVKYYQIFGIIIGFLILLGIIIFIAILIIRRSNKNKGYLPVKQVINGYKCALR